MTKTVMHDFRLVSPLRRSKMLRCAAISVSMGVCLWGLTTPAAANRVVSKAIGVVPITSSSATTAKQLTQMSPAALDRSTHDQVNRYRASKNLPPLQWNAAIAAQARKHSQAMAQGQTSFGHNGFAQRVQMLRIPYRGAAENVGYNQGYQQPVDVVVQGWLNSAGHRRNIEGSYDLTGVGVASNTQGEVYFTQIFLRSR